MAALTPHHLNPPPNGLAGGAVARNYRFGPVFASLKKSPVSETGTVTAEVEYSSEGQGTGEGDRGRFHLCTPLLPVSPETLSVMLMG